MFLIALTPNKWNIRFETHFRKKDRVYNGTAEGDLNGKIKGVATAGDKRRFGFTGRKKDGMIVCTHFETRKGKKNNKDLEQATGIMDLAEGKAPAASKEAK